MLDNPTKVMVEADHTIKVICYVNEDVMSREFHTLLYRYFLTICMPHDNIVQKLDLWMSCIPKLKVLILKTERNYKIRKSISIHCQFEFFYILYGS